MTKDKINFIRKQEWPKIILLGYIPEEMSLMEASGEVLMAWSMCLAGKELPKNGNFGKALANYNVKFGIMPYPIENIPIAENFNNEGNLIKH
jgi:hypothetical protein